MKQTTKDELRSIGLDTKMMAYTLRRHNEAIDKLAVIPEGTEDSFALLQIMQMNISADLMKMAKAIEVLMGCYDI